MPSDVTRNQVSNKAERRPKGRSVLLAHAMAQRENRLAAQRRAVEDQLDERKQADTTVDRSSPERMGPESAGRRVPANDRQPDARPVARPVSRADADGPKAPGLDDMIVKALGPSAHGHVRNGALDRESALTDLIARTQSRLNAHDEPTPAASAAVGPTIRTPEPPELKPEPTRPLPTGKDREAMIAAAMQTHREQQAVFDGLSLRDRVCLRATAEAIFDAEASARD